MSDSKQNGELIQWLRLLSLPTWMKVALVCFMMMLFAIGVGLIYFAYTTEKLEFAASGATLLTVWLPIALIIVALIFGVSGRKALNKETLTILSTEFPNSLKDALATDDDAQNASITSTVRGCIAKYDLRIKNYENQNIAKKIQFNVELNVRKVNLVIWFGTVGETTSLEAAFADFKLNNAGTLAGAEFEGYTLNDAPALTISEQQKRMGAVFIKELDDDFLMKAAHRLYWSNDCAFFIKGLLSGTDFDVQKNE